MQCPPQPGPGSKRMNPNGFVAARVEHLPDVDSHAVVDHLELVDQGDVHRAEDVLQQLGGLGGAGVRHPHHAGHHLLVELLRQVAGDLVGAADQLGDVRRRKIGVARVLALRRVGEEEVLAAAEAALQPLLREPRQQDLFGCARIGGRLQHHELPRPQALADLLRGDAHIAEVRLALRGERGGHADQNGVRLPQAGEVGAGREPPRLDLGADAFGVEVADVAVPAADRRDLDRVNVEAEDGEAPLGEGQREGKSDITQADHADQGGPVIDTAAEGVRDGGFLLGCAHHRSSPSLTS